MFMKLKQRAARHVFRKAARDLCERGLITCTRGNPGDDDAQYALAWLPLDHPEQFSADVRKRHAANMAKFRDGGGIEQ